MKTEKNFVKTPPAPLWIGEALKQGNLVYSILSLTWSFTVNYFETNQKSATGNFSLKSQ